jgi:hypothetical protein
MSRGKTNGRADALSREAWTMTKENATMHQRHSPPRPDCSSRSLIEIGAEHDEQDERTLTKWVDAHELKRIGESMVQERQASDHQHRCRGSREQ